MTKEELIMRVLKADDNTLNKISEVLGEVEKVERPNLTGKCFISWSGEYYIIKDGYNDKDHFVITNGISVSEDYIRVIDDEEYINYSETEDIISEEEFWKRYDELCSKIKSTHEMCGKNTASETSVS